MKIFLFSGRMLAVLTGTAFLSLASLIPLPRPVLAAEELILTYGMFQASIALTDLETLAQTGEASNGLKFYLGLANLEPSVLRTILTTEFTVDHNLLDDVFNSEGGEYLLSEITQVVHTPSQQANIQALRSAIVLAAEGDRQITLLEVLQNYPTQQVFISATNLLQLARELRTERVAEEAEE
ncbi:hypothetical protein C7B61_13260 [filamentous cyanobacterium CCP1]|nr:hypothetical protein C7B76_29470 [filamentous cyanobacterium CCP2]PSB63508.1 hypothetical protein C7B61_13260 [filamentous cyanobacterium CCP1]